MVERRHTERLLFRWLCPHHHLVIMLVLATLSFVLGYSISVGMKLIKPFPETISNTGTVPPASCVFGLLLSISSCFGVIFMYFRHGHLETKFQEDRRRHEINDVSFFFGFVSCFGILMVACFQVTNVWVPHMLGAALAFNMGCLYCWLQSYLSFVVEGKFNTKVILRFFLTISGSIGLLLYFVFALLARVNKNIDILHWDPKTPGYVFRCISTVFEWIIAISLLVYFLSFYKEFLEVDYKVHIQNKEIDTTIAANERYNAEAM